MEAILEYKNKQGKGTIAIWSNGKSDDKSLIEAAKLIIKPHSNRLFLTGEEEWKVKGII